LSKKKQKTERNQKKKTETEKEKRNGNPENATERARTSHHQPGNHRPADSITSQQGRIDCQLTRDGVCHPQLTGVDRN
jgi:hypothetical protein